MVTELADTGDIVGGDMVAPLVGGAFALSALYGAGLTFDSLRYWSDYLRNTGYRPRYPFKIGAYKGLTSDISNLYMLNKVIR